MRAGLIGAVVLFGILTGGLAVHAADGSEPEIEVFLPENIVAPGEETTVDLEIRNAVGPEDDESDAGETPTTQARDVTIRLRGEDTPVTVKTNETPLPQLDEQALLTEDFTIAVDEDAEPGTYELTAEVEYVFTDEGETERDRSVTLPVIVQVEEQARFAADEVDSSLVVGDRGTVAVNLTNTGVENASDAVVQFAAPDTDTELIAPTADESAVDVEASEEFVGEWAQGETETVTAAVDVAPEAIPRSYPITMTVSFRDDDGVEQASREIRVGAATAPEQRLTMEHLNSTLRVGEEGVVTGTVRNTGPNEMRNIVLIVDDDSDMFPAVPGDESVGRIGGVVPLEFQQSIGTLPVNETAEISFRYAAGREAEPGDRLIEFDVRYRNQADERRLTEETLDAPIAIAPQRDEFRITAVNQTYTPGSGAQLTLNITNIRDETFTDIEANTFANDPLSVGDNDEAFIPELAPGETTTVQFDIAVASTAAPQSYPLRLDFRYDDERGSSQLSDTYRVPISVTEAEDGLPGWVFVGGAMLLLGVIAAAWGLRRRGALPGVLQRR